MHSTKLNVEDTPLKESLELLYIKIFLMYALISTNNKIYVVKWIFD